MIAGRRVPALVIAGAWLLLAACTPAAHSGTGTPLPTAGASVVLTDGARITSERFGYSMVIPAGWAIRQASADWPRKDPFPLPAAAYTDNFEQPAGFPVIDVSTRALDPDESAGEVLAAISAGTEAIGCAVESQSDVTVDGETARFQRQLCANECEVVFEVVAFHADRVYVIYWLSLASEEGNAEEQFRAALGTFRFPE